MSQAMTVNQRIKTAEQQLTQRLSFMEELLPPQMKGQGSRLIKRAILTLARKPDMHQIPEVDLIRCVMEAAECGMAIDGKHGYIVKYKNTYQFQADYKGLVVALRRYGVIEDAYADVVRDGDDFSAGRENGQSFLRHSFPLSIQRGDVIGAYAVVVLPNKAWRYELMTREQLDAIQKRAPSKNGPWSTDVDEMRKKTVIRRALKMYVDDPAALRALEEPWETDVPAPAPVVEQSRVRTRLPVGNTATVPAATNGHAETEADVRPHMAPETDATYPEREIGGEPPEDTSPPATLDQEAAGNDLAQRIKAAKAGDETLSIIQDVDAAFHRGDITQAMQARLRAEIEAKQKKGRK